MLIVVIFNFGIPQFPAQISLHRAARSLSHVVSCLALCLLGCESARAEECRSDERTKNQSIRGWRSVNPLNKKLYFDSNAI